MNVRSVLSPECQNKFVRLIVHHRPLLSASSRCRPCSPNIILITKVLYAFELENLSGSFRSEVLSWSLRYLSRAVISGFGPFHVDQALWGLWHSKRFIYELDWYLRPDLYKNQWCSNKKTWHSSLNRPWFFERPTIVTSLTSPVQPNAWHFDRIESE